MEQPGATPQDDPSGRPRRRWLATPPGDPERQARVYAGRALLGVLVGALAAVLLLTAMYPALRFTAARPQRTTAAPAPATITEQPAVARAAAAPATTVVERLLAATPAGLPEGLVDASSVPGTVAPAVALSCDSPVAPVVSRSRTWARPPAPGAAAGSGVTVTVTAYSAGAGAPALDAMVVARKECVADATVTRTDGYGVQAVLATQQRGQVDTRSVVLRRGDVLVSVSGTGLPLPTAVAADLDRRLDQALAPVCAQQRSTTADFARSPLVARQDYTGLQVLAGVDLPGQGTPLPDLVAAHVGAPLPPQVTPTTPAAPYWPEAAPAPVPSPSEPPAPTPYPVRTTYPAPARDDRGPGCGWAFTGMAPPTFDEQAAARTQEQRRQAAVTAMQAAVAAYPAAVQAYEQAWGDYERRAKAYTDYATKAQEVEAAWAVIRVQQEAYRQSLAQYQQATAAYQAELTRRQGLQATYDAQLARCATATPPVPSTPAPPPPGAPPTVAPPPTVPGCPPTRDPSLDLPMAPPPASPSPPPDPRPTPRP
ncbi:hypothetical protein [Arsenicicoccus sp. oral taxon 190]|uniref:hypothetical protein n=1 Tax=Arsenicicoccus sp. oral taxon 190 TaxID=1658671 RepID=UPI00067A018A|nr:hypothetical protein [Arsenicicoccus sp. oral taxon 190]AKT51784.1 hypothetical protein ADJ73_11735 [Arsenicicoccus sp. oral taxon 190]